MPYGTGAPARPTPFVGNRDQVRVPSKPRDRRVAPEPLQRACHQPGAERVPLHRPVRRPGTGRRTPCGILRADEVPATRMPSGGRRHPLFFIHLHVMRSRYSGPRSAQGEDYLVAVCFRKCRMTLSVMSPWELRYTHCRSMTSSIDSDSATFSIAA